MNIKPCRVNLIESNFSKIKIGCSAQLSELGVILECNLKQENVNTFTLQVKRKWNDDFHDGMPSTSNPSKRLKLSSHSKSPKQIKPYDLRPKQCTGKKEMYTSNFSTLSAIFGLILDPVRKDASKGKSTCKALVRRRFAPKKCDKIEIGQIVLFKLRGFCEWPAFVTGINGNKIDVEFFGDQTVQNGTIAHFYTFEDNHELIAANYMTKKNIFAKALYGKAIREAESVLGIRAENSIFNQYFMF